MISEEEEYKAARPQTSILGKVPIPSDEDFASWTKNPVTIFVAAYHKRMAEDAKTEWESYSWNSGKSIAPELLYKVLQELRTREEIYSSFLENTKETYEHKLKQR